MHGQLSQAMERVAPYQPSLNASDWKQLTNSLAVYAKACEHFIPQSFQAATNQPSIGLEFLLASEAASGIEQAPKMGQVARMPHLPCVEKGLIAGRSALSLLMLPSVGNIETSVARIKSSWEHHPEALIPMCAAMFLHSRQPAIGPKSAPLLALEADLFQLAADSPSFIGGLDRSARYLAAKTELELLESNPTNAAALRHACFGNVRSALADVQTTAAELQAHLNIAVQLGEYDTARELVVRWEECQPGDASARHARIEVEIGAGNVETAWKLVNQKLADTPNDPSALAQRERIQKTLDGLMDDIHHFGR